MVQLKLKQILTAWDACDLAIRKHCCKGFFFKRQNAGGNVMLEDAVTGRCSASRDGNLVLQLLIAKT